MDVFFYYFKIGQKTDFEIALTEKLEKHWVFFFMVSFLIKRCQRFLPQPFSYFLAKVIKC